MHKYKHDEKDWEESLQLIEFFFLVLIASFSCHCLPFTLLNDKAVYVLNTVCIFNLHNTDVITVSVRDDHTSGCHIWRIWCLLETKMCDC